VPEEHLEQEGDPELQILDLAVSQPRVQGLLAGLGEAEDPLVRQPFRGTAGRLGSGKVG
jgi:hypothetical protein